MRLQIGVATLLVFACCTANSDLGDPEERLASFADKIVQIHTYRNGVKLYMNLERIPHVGFKVNFKEFRAEDEQYADYWEIVKVGRQAGINLPLYEIRQSPYNWFCLDNLKVSTEVGTSVKIDQCQEKVTQRWYVMEMCGSNAFTFAPPYMITHRLDCDSHLEPNTWTKNGGTNQCMHLTEA